MGFDVAAEHYDRFMGRYAVRLSAPMADLMRLASGLSVLDVGCGTGALTGEMVARLGAAAVSAVDTSASFVDAVLSRYPAVAAQVAPAEDLPFADDMFDACGAQLVLHLVRDARAASGEMVRVTRPGGTVAACVWDFTTDDDGPLAPFWRAVHALDPQAPGEANLPGVRQGGLVALLRDAGLEQVEQSVLTAQVRHAGFGVWWQPFTLGVGPAGAYLRAADERARQRLRDACRALLPDGPFTTTAHAWAARGVVGR